MKNDLEHTYVAFHNRARNVLLSLYSDFKQSALSLDRQKDENVFQQLQGRYLSRLKHQLQSVSLEILNQTEQGFNRHQLNNALSRFIEEYTKEFIQKTRSL